MRASLPVDVKTCTVEGRNDTGSKRHRVEMLDVDRRCYVTRRLSASIGVPKSIKAKMS